ncbi:heterokaryon incompatibility protein-domain-containing protein [Triangularia setosa]|uniref:Heterokaryon incompatibility protein-domain-containing protein n=1 Tax=Triangularia setosa TaxID=2587417 RepID=A0AAN6W397_9PEZI|nr:heterokaryon incompatibility protein-domain-containing protein [Podospora setosa]
MDSLVDEIGKPPYWITALTGVHQEGLSLLHHIQSGSAVDIPTAAQTIDKLEALASVCFNAYDNEFILFGTGSDASLANLTSTIYRLKRAVFSRQGSPVSKPSNVCLFCGWVLQRLGNGVVGRRGRLSRKHLWTSWQGPQWIANCYLCAIDTWPSFPRLEASAEIGCDFCRFLKELIDKKGGQLSPSHPDSDWTEVGVWVDFRGVPRKQVTDEGIVRPELLNTLEYGSVFLSTTSPWSSTPVWQFMVESRDKKVADELQVFTSPAEESWSSPNIDFARSTLSTTKPEIESETIAALAAFTPTRLLDLGDPHDPSIKLIITTQPPLASSNIEYAALSYCWGPKEDAAQQTTLTTSNLASRRKEITPDQLSPVMHDAVKVCQSLEIRYLWIDALCIIQDSKTDWEQQSQQMSRVYEGAYLTICAMASSSCLEGFLPKRPVWPKYRYTSPINPDFVSGSFTLRPVSSNDSVFAVASNPPLEQDLSIASWNERGWVFQEKSMSTRKLFFGRAMLHVQMNSVVHSENGHEGAVEVNSLDDRTMPDNSIPLGQLLRCTQQNNPYDLWNSIVLRFARLKWTDKTDFFPGLSGPAERFRDVLGGDEYLAGHWSGDLGSSLIWTTGRRDVKRPGSLSVVLERLREGNDLHGPSWSWPGREDFFRFVHSTLDGRKSRVRTHLRPEFALLKSNVVVDGVNPFGRLREGANSLVISGRTINVSDVFPNNSTTGWTFTESADWECSNLAKGYLIMVSHDWDGGPRSYDGKGPPRGTTGGELSSLELLLLSSCCSDYSSELPAGSLKPGTETTTKVLFPPEYGKTFLNDPDFRPSDGTCSFCRDQQRKRDVWGLLMHPADVPGRYYRVGIFCSRAQHGGSELFNEAAACEVELI